jgi:hypothetical protein
LKELREARLYVDLAYCALACADVEGRGQSAVLFLRLILARCHRRIEDLIAQTAQQTPREKIN